MLETTADWADARRLSERNSFVLDREQDAAACRDAFYVLQLDAAGQES